MGRFALVATCSAARMLDAHPISWKRFSARVGWTLRTWSSTVATSLSSLIQVSAAPARNATESIERQYLRILAQFIKALRGMCPIGYYQESPRWKANGREVDVLN